MSQMVSSAHDPDRLDLDEIRLFLAGRWKLIAATAFACAALALAICLLLKPVYTATSQVLLDPHKQHVFGGDAVSPDSALDSGIVDSQIPIITSTRLLAKVIKKEHLDEDPEFAASAKQGLLDRLFSVLKGTKVKEAEQPSLDGIDPQLAPVILHFFRKVEVSRLAKSYVLSVSVSSNDAAKATRLANSLAQTYVEDQVNVHAKSIQQAATFFEERLGRLRDQVRTSERAVADFRQAHNLTTITMDGKVTLSEEQLQDLDKQLALASTESAEKLARFEQAKRFKTAGSNVDTLPDIVRSPLITQLRTQEADLIRREADLSATYGPSYPAITQIHAQRAGLDRAIASEIRRLLSTLHNDWEVSKAREDSLRKTIVGLTEISGGDNDVGVKLRELERANMANKALFENFLNRAKLTQEQSSFEDPEARLISPALEPTAPSSPKIKLIVAVAFIVGIVLGLALAAVANVFDKRERLDPKARTAFILGRVPDIGRRFATADELRTYLATHRGSDLAESIDAIATKLASPSEVEAGPGPARGQSVALVPLGAGDDVSSLAIAVATVIGAKGRRVLLVDMDGTRRPLSGALGATGELGIADVLAGDLTASKAAVRRAEFSFLSAGRKPLDAAASRSRSAAFLTEARGRFDVILMSFPTFDASAAALGDIVDRLALVASWESLKRGSFVAAVDGASERPNFAGVVLTRISAADDQDFALAS